MEYLGILSTNLNVKDLSKDDSSNEERTELEKAFDLPLQILKNQKLSLDEGIGTRKFAKDQTVKLSQKLGTKYEASPETRIALAFDKFDYWVKTYNMRGETKAHVLVLRWLYNDGGGELIATYEEFLKLTLLLKNSEHNLSETPSKTEFEKAMIKLSQKETKRRV